MVKEMNEEHKYKEGFCHMKYQCQRCRHIISIWNSRNGVTPFITGCSKCGGEMQHVAWNQDRYDPNYYPEKGDWIWVDLPRSIFELHMKLRIRLYWDHKEFPMSKSYDSKEAALEALMKGFEDGQPYLIRL